MAYIDPKFYESQLRYMRELEKRLEGKTFEQRVCYFCWVPAKYYCWKCGFKAITVREPQC